MNHWFPRLTLLIVLLWIPGSAIWAQAEMFTGTPSPMPSFLTDHSYDNTDVDGTSLKQEHKTDGSDDLEPIVDPSVKNDPAPESVPVKSKKDAGLTPTREPDINGL